MIWKNLNSTTRLRILILMLLIAGSIVPGAWSLGRTHDWNSFAVNFSTEMAGAVVTFILLEVIIRQREVLEAEREKEEARKKELVDRLGSNVREITLAAADDLRRNGWLDNGILREVRLRRANLNGVNLSKSDLTGANLHRAELEKADLWDANLSEADLSGAWLNEARLWQANLQDANLWQARMQGVNLRSANLEGARLNECRMDGADLREANLQNANLTGARMDGANLRGTVFSPETILPDGTNWTPETDMNRFVDTHHPRFWRNGKQQ